MPDLLDQARKAIEARLRELEDEARHLRDALGNLDHHRLGGKRRPTTTKPRSKARRAPRGQRQKQFLAAVKKDPGAPVSQIAKDMGVAPNQLYPIARRLHQKGEIRKRGKGYAVKS
jgi:hypothetical protein